MPSMRPRREFRSPMIVPIYSSGTVTSTVITRLQKHGLGLLRSLLEGHRTRDLEGHFVRVDIVVATVIQRHLDVDHLVAREHTTRHRLLNTLLDWLEVLLPNHAALDVVDELIALARLVRLNANLGVAVVTRATCLANILALGLGLAADGLAVVHLRL